MNPQVSVKFDAGQRERERKGMRRRSNDEDAFWQLLMAAVPSPAEQNKRRNEEKDYL